MTQALLLFSGGLDSSLALKLMVDQGIKLVALNFITPFCTCNRKGRCESQHVAEKFGIPLRVFNIGNEYLELIRKPRFGYGSHMNPCLDCRIFMLKKAKAYMEEVGAEFIVTGEVLGQRPMSQHKQALKLIEKEAGLEGKILRPLSAKLLKPTEAEQDDGPVEREQLLDIRGRSRKPQIALAEKLGVEDYVCPAGGCLLTDPQFAKRIKDLFQHTDNVTVRDVEILKVGRHFRLSPETKVIIGRDDQENQRLLRMAREDDLCLRVTDFPGPITLLRGEQTPENVGKAARLVVRYSDARTSWAKVAYRKRTAAYDYTVVASPMPEETIREVRI